MCRATATWDHGRPDDGPGREEDNGLGMRIVSLLPSATEIVFALGLGDQLVGRTHACDHPPGVEDTPVVTVGPDVTVGRQAHDRACQALHGSSATLRLDMDLLRALEPDLVLAQERCDSCALRRRDVSDAVRALGGHTMLVSLEAHSVEGILNTIATVGAFTEAEDEAIGLIELLRERLGVIENRVLERRLQGMPSRRTVVLEWLDPLFTSGHWIPEMVRRAGGWELLGADREVSAETSWERVRQVDPEVIVLALCGLDADGAARELTLASLPGWFDALEAVREGELFAVDGAGLFLRPGPRVIDGIAVLAELLDPEGFAGAGPAEAWIPLGPVSFGASSSTA